MQHLGDSVSLSCSAGGSPLPKVKWFKEGRPITTTTVPDGNGVTESKLVILGFQPSDAGKYACLFYNDKNDTAEATTSIGKHIIHLKAFSHATHGSNPCSSPFEDS